jgi:hypothetical protein
MSDAAEKSAIATQAEALRAQIDVQTAKFKTLPAVQSLLAKADEMNEKIASAKNSEQAQKLLDAMSSLSNTIGNLVNKALDTEAGKAMVAKQAELSSTITAKVNEIFGKK